MRALQHVQGLKSWNQVRSVRSSPSVFSRFSAGYVRDCASCVRAVPVYFSYLILICLFLIDRNLRRLVPRDSNFLQGACARARNEHSILCYYFHRTSPDIERYRVQLFR